MEEQADQRDDELEAIMSKEETMPLKAVDKSIQWVKATGNPAIIRKKGDIWYYHDFGTGEEHHLKVEEFEGETVISMDSDPFDWPDRPSPDVMHALILDTRMRFRIARTSGTLSTTGSLRVFFGRIV